jgi:hypothetical protein
LGARILGMEPWLGMDGWFVDGPPAFRSRMDWAALGAARAALCLGSRTMAVMPIEDGPVG